MSDHRTLIAQHISGQARYDMLDEVDAILATRVPDLCPDCKGTGEVGDIPELRIPSVSCDHLNAPTIADLLRWGEAAYRQGVTQ